MTPELKVACEVVFQEHKVYSHPIKWNYDTFRGRISLGLSEMAKETLIKKNIIVLPNKQKKIFTLLNPVVATAGNVEEAEEMIKNKVQILVTSIQDDRPSYISHQQVADPGILPAKYSHRVLSIAGTADNPAATIKWYMKPFFYYIVWPVCALVAGAAIAYLIGLAYTALFLDMK